MERLLKRSAHWTAKFRHRDYLPVFVVVAIGLAATAMAGDAFMDIAETLQADSPKLHAIDGAIHEWANTTRTPGATTFFTTLTLIGTPIGLGILIALVTAFLAFRRRWRGPLLIITSTSAAAHLQLSRLRPRPPEIAKPARRTRYSFPAAAMGSTICSALLSTVVRILVLHYRARRWHARHDDPRQSRLPRYLGVNGFRTSAPASRG